ncbi:uncharacterized protein Tco025E_02382 [Trypanosoma conorhini]|uniref:Uncharacterized protein n=1 Tax=Trypanosoma conorhini TaxID=83891 RepID=A0A422Q444_9TRYP|nr:uncharacterized protein Tco025E_02382 [Trypanosoma conorhini]RNF24702.1 hypothetical protein Tco025E_02382 [Trypanosoma conorhini]
MSRLAQPNSSRIKPRGRTRRALVVLATALGLLLWILVALRLQYGGDGATAETPVETSLTPAARSRVPTAAFSTTATISAGSGKSYPMFLTGNMARAVNSIVLPYRYPMHRHLPTNRSAVAAAIQEKQVRRQAGCWATAHASPLFPAPTTHASATLRSVRLEAADVMLQQEYFLRVKRRQTL